MHPRHVRLSLRFRLVFQILCLTLVLTPGAATLAQEEPDAAEPANDESAPRPMTTDDALDMVGVSAQAMSPDGEWVLFSRRKLDWKENKYETEIWMAPTDGGEAFRYLGEDGGSDFRFSPDGKYLTFKRSAGEGKKKTSQLFWMRSSGGEAIQLTKHATSVGQYRWAADSSRIFFVAQDKRDKDAQKAIDDGADVIFVDEGPNGQTQSQWSNLWAFTIEEVEGEEREQQLTEEEFLVGGFDPSPDGRWVALTARYTNRRNDGDKTEIFLLDVESGEKTRLTDNRAPEGGVLWSPDSRRFVYSAGDDKEWLNRNSKLWLMEAQLGEHRLLTANFAGNVSGAPWSPDGAHIFFNGSQGPNSNVFRVDAETGAIDQVTELDGSTRASHWSADRGRFVYTVSDYDTPSDIWVGNADGTPATRVTDANPQLADLQLATMRLLTWTSTDGTEIEGLVHLPADYDETRTYPLMLNIHGGPAGVFSNSFRASYHVYAGLGWAALSPNVRGSCCYDDTLREGNTVAREDGIGFGDYQDLMTGVDALIANDVVDADRMALRGWSYGGILGGWTITQTERFKAASIGAGVYDWSSEYGPGFNNDVRLWHIGGSPWDNPEGYRKQSAFTHVANITTPTLLIHGMNDTTDTEPQSMMLFNAIKDIGKAPVRYMRVPREPHGFREPQHQRQRDIEEIRWMHEHVLGEEWTPWERSSDKDEREDEEETEGDTESTP
jgi:dipeptidyl aminopeptidase/acylaminoacyl peptidase